MYQSSNYRNTQHPDCACLPKKFMYGLKQVPCTLYQHFTGFVATLSFSHNACVCSLLIYRSENNTTSILLYVDDIILTASSDILRKFITYKMRFKFDIKDLCHLSYFLDISVTT